MFSFLFTTGKKGKQKELLTGRRDILGFFFLFQKDKANT